MAYSDFTFDSATEKFALEREERLSLFGQVAEVAPRQSLLEILADNVPLGLAIGTEKARSETMIAPVLIEARRLTDYGVSLFSGTEFNVDPSQGLNGYCDFIVSASREQFTLRAPVLMIVEAKQENIPGGFGQCIAEMVAARLFNRQKANGLTMIYGAVTTGDNWRFLKLDGQTILIDKQQYQISQTGKLIGILLEIFQAKPLAQAKAA